MRVKINISFILFLFLSIYLGYWKITLIIFLSVLIHEFGHTFIARKLGIKVLEVQFYPFGAIAVMENITKYGGFNELMIALSGPVMSLLVALIFFYSKVPDRDLVFKYNMALFLFNLLPALPLDGGRVMRNILLMRLSYKKATKIMTAFGKLLAIGLIVINIYLIINDITTAAYIITAIFIFLGALREEKNCSYVYLLNRNNKKEKILKRKNYKTRLLISSKGTYLKNLIEQFSPGNICRVRVFDENNNIIDELSEADIINGFLTKGYYSKIEDIL